MVISFFYFLCRVENCTQTIDWKRRSRVNCTVHYTCYYLVNFRFQFLGPTAGRRHVRYVRKLVVSLRRFTANEGLEKGYILIHVCICAYTSTYIVYRMVFLSHDRLICAFFSLVVQIETY